MNKEEHVGFHKVISVDFYEYINENFDKKELT